MPRIVRSGLVYHGHASTGRRGYRGQPGTTSARAHRMNRLPLSFWMGCACAHDAQRPGGGVGYDPVMSMSEATTRGVRVRVRAEFSPEHSSPGDDRWFFLYTIDIANEGNETVQLVTRHWIITDGTGQVEEIRGPGVVGRQPILEPGDSFGTPRGARCASRSARCRAPTRW